ncbi:MAG TPA: hypothetical protein VMP08_08545 [Anaerolineae bacterium]|nr:hypothetical protein [Anaerolineae bacterium]
MKSGFIQQYAHTWRVLAGIIKDFDRETWLHYGCGTMTPARDTFHLLQGVKYYIEDSSTVTFASGKSFDSHCGTVPEAELPSQADVLACIAVLQTKTEAWLCTMSFEAENKSFEWTGQTQFSVALFLLRHMLYHIGELSSMLNESKHGMTEDNWTKTL